MISEMRLQRQGSSSKLYLITYCIAIVPTLIARAEEVIE
jgi:hypothetical protein